MNDANQGLTRLERMIEDVYAYVNLRIVQAKLNLIESLSELFSNIIAILIFGVFALLSLMLFSVALVVWLGGILGSILAAMLIVGGFYLIIAVIVILLRNRIMTGSMVRMFCRMFFKPKTDDHGQE